MSMKERNAERSTLASRWHREDSTRRFLTAKQANWLHAIDIDFCEVCNLCGEPVALWEAKLEGESNMATTITERLARRAFLPAYLVVITPNMEDSDVGVFRRKMVYPNREREFTELDGLGFARWLWSLRYSSKAHPCVPAPSAQVERDRQLEPLRKDAA